MNTSQFDIDRLTSIATLIIAICAFFSPIVTCLLNNWHQRIMKKLEYEHEDKVAREKWVRDVYDGYIQAADAYIHTSSEETQREFGRHSGLAMRYVPDDLRQQMLELEKMFYSSYGQFNAIQKIDALNAIIVKMQQVPEPKCK